MPKINQEEYEKIKSLPDYDWNWIAREKTGKILGFTNKPTKTDEVWKDEQTRLWFNYKDSQLFQFIQWEDEEPYEIAELIREYEIKELRLAPSGTVIVDSFDESEETEVLSQEWIDEHAKAVSYDGMPDQTEIVYVDELEKLIVPKKELPVIPKFVADYLEKAKKEIDLLRVFEIANGLDELEIWRKEYNWIRLYHLDFARAWLDGYELEEEQKYHVTDENDTLLCKSNGVVMTVGKLWAIGNEHEAEYDLTEQETKDYDERFWAFAVEVAE